MAREFERIQAAAIDERAHTVFYRQTELESLCKALLREANSIRDAISSDYDYTEAEVNVEYNLVLSSVKSAYVSLRPKKALEEEYSIASGKDAPNHRAPAGIVYIEPSVHNLFYSVVVPLTAALAAGNCVILLLENNLRATSSLLRRILTAALQSDTFALASSPLSDKHLLEKAVIVRQNGNEGNPTINELVSLPRRRTVAVVDRTADVRLAARELVSARFAFGGQSPYAPDIILVNEFSKKHFLQAVVSECVNFGSGVNLNDAAAKATKPSKVVEQIDAFQKIDADLRIVIQEPKFAVVDLPSRLGKIPASKVDASLIVVHGIRSLDDAIDLVQKSSDVSYLAAYYFSDPASAKYLSQFVDSAVSFVNHVPREILVGPAFPATYQFHLGERYPAPLFSRAKPAFINAPRSNAPLTAALSSSSNAAAQKLWSEATLPLKVMKRSPGGNIGHFEMGLLLNASLILVSTVSLSATGIWYLRRWYRA